MNFIKKKKERIIFSAAVGMLVCMFTVGESRPHMQLAWWGFLYPQFCIVREAEDIIDSGVPNEKKEIQFSLWLAKAFEW